MYLKTHNTDDRQTSIFLVGLEPTISASDRPQTYALDSAAIGTSIKGILEYLIFFKTKNMLSNLGY